MSSKKGSASAEMHGTPAERRAARLAALGWSDGMAVSDRRAAARRRALGRAEETVPLMTGYVAAYAGEEESGPSLASGTAGERIVRGNRYLAQARIIEDQARDEAASSTRPSRDEDDIGRPTLAQVIARSNARISRQIAELESDETTTQQIRALAALDTTWRPLPLFLSEEGGAGVRRNATTRFVASPEPISAEIDPAPMLTSEQMTSRGRLVVDRSRTAGQPPQPPSSHLLPRIAEASRPSPRTRAPAPSSTTEDDRPAIRSAHHDRMARRFRAENGISFPRPPGDYPEYRPPSSSSESRVVPVDEAEFPTPAEARVDLMARVQAIAQSSTVLDDTPPVRPDPGPDTFGDQAMAELRLLQNTVTRLNDRLEVARSNMAMLAAARVSLREHEENVERIAAEGRFPPTSTEPVMDIARPPPASQTLARRPSFPYPRNTSHPHHRPRLDSNHPIALVMNMDNMNSFDINFDGNIVFRPISARDPARELIARCLSMLPGGRDGTPSRWMRLTGATGSRPRRAGTSAGYWVRWVSDDTERTGLRHRSLDMTTLPRITAFDFAVSPPDDECWVRADEIEFYTPRTRLRSTLGPWMHSRVRVEPFDNDPPSAAWGTSAHVRQAVQQVGGLPMGHYMRYHFRERRVEARTPDDRHSASPPRAALERVLDSYEVMDATSDAVPAIHLDAHIGETDDPENAWLMSYEPAIGQIRASWRAHYRRTRDDDPQTGAAVFTAITREDTGPTRTGTPRNELWSRGESTRNLGIAKLTFPQITWTKMACHCPLCRSIKSFISQYESSHRWLPLEPSRATMRHLRDESRMYECPISTLDGSVVARGAGS